MSLKYVMSEKKLLVFSLLIPLYHLPLNQLTNDEWIETEPSVCLSTPDVSEDHEVQSDLALVTWQYKWLAHHLCCLFYVAVFVTWLLLCISVVI
jgi:hypothetical protein